jgi:hypothetical protein
LLDVHNISTERLPLRTIDACDAQLEEAEAQGPQEQPVVAMSSIEATAAICVADQRTVSTQSAMVSRLLSLAASTAERSLWKPQ